MICSPQQQVRVRIEISFFQHRHLPVALSIPGPPKINPIGRELEIFLRENGICYAPGPPAFCY